MSWSEFVKGMMRLADEQLFSDMKAWRAANPVEVKHKFVIETTPASGPNRFANLARSGARSGFAVCGDLDGRKVWWNRTARAREVRKGGVPIMRKLESSKYEPDYSGDRQTGRTTRAVIEAFKKNAYFIVHNEAMRDYVLSEIIELAMRDWAIRRVLVVRGDGDLRYRVSGRRGMKLVFDHAVWEHGTIKQQEECRHAQAVVDSYMTP